jgi:hypothetical protein
LRPVSLAEILTMIEAKFLLAQGGPQSRPIRLSLITRCL